MQWPLLRAAGKARAYVGCLSPQATSATGQVTRLGRSNDVMKSLHPSWEDVEVSGAGFDALRAVRAVHIEVWDWDKNLSLAPTLAPAPTPALTPTPTLTLPLNPTLTPTLTPQPSPSPSHPPPPPN